MPKFMIMNRSGHSEEAFDKANVVSVAEAEKRFKELTGEGFIAAKVTGQGTQELIRAFDPNAEEIIFHPHLQGG